MITDLYVSLYPKEREREAKIELKRLVDAQQAEAKRIQTKKRIEKNLTAARQQQESKRSELLQKRARHEEFMNEIERERYAESKELKRINEIRDRKRKNQLKMSKQKEEEVKMKSKSKIEQGEDHLKQLAEKRRKEQMLIKAERDLQMQLKKDNLARIKRANEYKQKEMTRKAQEDDRRCLEMKQKREQLLRERQKNVAIAKCVCFVVVVMLLIDEQHLTLLVSRIKKDKLLEGLSNAQTSAGMKKLLKSVQQQSLLSNNRPNDNDDSLGSSTPLPRDNDAEKQPIASTPKSLLIRDDFHGIGDISISPLAHT